MHPVFCQSAIPIGQPNSSSASICQASVTAELPSSERVFFSTC